MSKNTNFLFKLDLLILSLLMEKDCYGYEMTKIISKESNNLIVPKVGTLYPTLHELLDNKYISSYEQYIGTKARVYYHIEESGKTYYQSIVKDYHELVKAIDSIVKKGEDNNE
ncbi:MAG: PadR family transcriptional regulator [Erysipelotrichaceae bacterium]|nr:PadR family transcriptional regulator [Erysipelotrichaceae bacterium]